VNVSPAENKKPRFEITQSEIDKFKDIFPAHYDFLVQCVKDGFFVIVSEPTAAKVQN
jgi:hypothetical protein